MQTRILLCILFFLLNDCKLIQAQFVSVADAGVSLFEESRQVIEQECISDEEYLILERRCRENMKALNISVVQDSGNENVLQLLDWPLRAANGLTDCNFYHISAYVDHNITTGTIQDFNCGTITYDSHKGTDISIWPFSFYKMDNDLVEVISAAPGIIIDKHDGEFDRNCAATTVSANYVFIQHSDGSHALYWHMKNGSITNKAIGQSVVAGELLGVVGSSGSSSGPHLHFEIWSGGTVSTRVDPYSGSCNLLNPASWWISQKPYREPSILKASVHTTDAVFPGCPLTETSNESTVFQVPFQGPGLAPGYAKFYVFFRNEQSGLSADISILNPNGSTFSSWTYTSANDARVRSWAWSKLLPTIPGTYTFRATYNGTECSSDFEITTSTDVSEQLANSGLRLYPNPSTGIFSFENARSEVLEITLFDIRGVAVFQSALNFGLTDFDLSFEKGLYYYKVRGKDGFICSGKLLIQ
ncbi:MAG: peptidoglycan DD-metalloendopeptidase family protein [Bacteroidia bacterium]|nr:peptidoglycan DD-metalloendopeptidase family protein [Bacteroidia bacterium]